MDLKPARSRVRLKPSRFGVVVLVLMAGLLALEVRSSAAQTTDTDADSYADDVEKQLGSSPTDPDNTPEHFALPWTCSDGNDNDRDRKRDFFDPGCRNTAGSTTSQGLMSSGAAGGGPSEGGSDDEASSGSGRAIPSDGGSSGANDDAVLGGSGAPIGDTAAGDAADATGSLGADQGSDAGTDSAASDSTSADTAADGAGDRDAAVRDDSGDGGFPWLISLVILVAGFAVGAICWALLGPKKARSRRGATSARY